MIVAKRQKIANKYSKYLYLYDTNKDGLSDEKILRTKIFADDISDEPSDIFEVQLDNDDAYILDKNNNEIDTGYSSKDLRRFFWCQIV